MYMNTSFEHEVTSATVCMYMYMYAVADVHMYIYGIPYTYMVHHTMHTWLGEANGLKDC